MIAPPGWDKMLAFGLAFGTVLLAGNPYIRFLQRRYLGQYIREDGPQSHQGKAGTPTAGGVLILAALVVAWLGVGIADPAFMRSADVLWVMGITLGLGLLGFADDYLKISKKKNKGVSGYTKLLVQMAAGIGIGVYMLSHDPAGPVSVFGVTVILLGMLFSLFSAVVVTGASNAVNLTDGLDGLASSSAILSFMAIALMLAPLHPLAGHAVPAHQDLALVAHMLAGACLGFLMFNRHPARIFMGDTGSLALGGALGAIGVLCDLSSWLLLLGAVYVIETLSVILQVISFKTTGRRIFRMSPLHHHFELLGLSETRVVWSFVTFQFICATLAVFLYFSVK